MTCRLESDAAVSYSLVHHLCAALPVLSADLVAACPGRNFAIAELCMLAARLMQTFNFAEPEIRERLSFTDNDFEVLGPARGQAVEIIDLDGVVKTMIHPGNASDTGVPGMTASNIPMNEFTCKLIPRG